MSLRDRPKLPLPFQPCDDDGPVFRQPWEAHAFALTVQLFEGGAFTWSEWTDALTTEIAGAKSRGDPDCGDTYYHHWLSALEKLVVKKGLQSMEAIDARAETWRRAYIATPHGKTVNLESGELSSLTLS